MDISFLEHFLLDSVIRPAHHFESCYNDENKSESKITNISISASLSGAIRVLLAYDPVRKESVIVKLSLITSRTLFCRIDTVDVCNPVIFKISF